MLFGSAAKGTATKESDIDILCVAKGKTGIDKVAREMYAKYGREVNVVAMKPEDFRKQKGKAAIKGIVENHCVLHGTENFVNLAFGK